MFNLTKKGWLEYEKAFKSNSYDTLLGDDYLNACIL